MTEEPKNMPLEFKLRLNAAKAVVAAARLGGSKLALANALKELGNIERRPPFLREDANRTFTEAAQLYRELELPLEAAWVIRHIGINHEYAELLEEAEASYDESLALFRRHAEGNSLNYANTVRYPAVIKNRLGKREESTELWEEALRRYAELDAAVAVAEAAAWLTIFAIERSDVQSARNWFSKAAAAAEASNDPDTDTFINQVKSRLEQAEDL